MKPIYFPYTFVPSEIVEAGAACFGEMIVYQPSGLGIPPQMADAAKKGLLDIHVPVKDDTKQIFSVLNEYKSWAEVHKDTDGIRLALRTNTKRQMPFMDECSIMKIREDIQRRINRTDTIEEKPDPLFSARVFLRMAHEFDMHHYDINQGIRQLNITEQDLMRNLQGGDEVFDKDSIRDGAFRADDPSDFMITERIEAWSGLMLHEQKHNEVSGLFVTSYRSVFAYMVENFSEGEMVLKAENIPIHENRIEKIQGWRDVFNKNIQRYTQDPCPVMMDKMLNIPADTGCGRTMSLSMYIIPGKSPLDVFARFFPHELDYSYPKNGGWKIKNTLIGLFEIQA